MNLGAFAVVLAVARKTRSAEISTWGGLFEYAPGLTVLMTMFLFSLAGIPPLGGWLAKFVVFRSLLEPDVTARRRRPRGRRRRELGDRALLLRQRRQDDVDGPGARRRPRPGPRAVLPRRRPRHLDHHDGRLRRQQPRHQVRRPRRSSSPRRPAHLGEPCASWPSTASARPARRRARSAVLGRARRLRGERDWITPCEDLVTPVEELVRAAIERRGPIPFDEVMALALYHPEHGFYATGGQAGRRGDFLTSPEVGPLFGAVVAARSTRGGPTPASPTSSRWSRRAPGPGTLARSVLAAAPALRAGAALRARRGVRPPAGPPRRAPRARRRRRSPSRACPIPTRTTSPSSSPPGRSS